MSLNRTRSTKLQNEKEQTKTNLMSKCSTMSKTVQPITITTDHNHGLTNINVQLNMIGEQCKPSHTLISMH